MKNITKKNNKKIEMSDPWFNIRLNNNLKLFKNQLESIDKSIDKMSKISSPYVILFSDLHVELKNELYIEINLNIK
jgi:hypothetical protein